MSWIIFNRARSHFVLKVVIALRPQTLKQIRGGWSHYTDTSKPVDGNPWGSKYGHWPIRISNQVPFDHWPNALTNCTDVCFRFEKKGQALLVLTPAEEDRMVQELKAKKIPLRKIKYNQYYLYTVCVCVCARARVCVCGCGCVCVCSCVPNDD
jgi:hypothetical protein